MLLIAAMLIRCWRDVVTRQALMMLRHTITLMLIRHYRRCYVAPAHYQMICWHYNEMNTETDTLRCPLRYAAAITLHAIRNVTASLLPLLLLLPMLPCHIDTTLLLMFTLPPYFDFRAALPALLRHAAAIVYAKPP